MDWTNQNRTDIIKYNHEADWSKLNNLLKISKHESPEFI